MAQPKTKHEFIRQRIWLAIPWVICIIFVSWNSYETAQRNRKSDVVLGGRGKWMQDTNMYQRNVIENIRYLHEEIASMTGDRWSGNYHDEWEAKFCKINGLIPVDYAPKKSFKMKALPPKFKLPELPSEVTK